MNTESLRITTHAPDFNVDYPTTFQLEGRGCLSLANDTFVQTQVRMHQPLKFRMIDQIVVLQRLLNHEQIVLIEFF